MKYAIETHRYAPELNKVIRAVRQAGVYEKFVAIPAPGCTSLREYRKTHKPRPFFIQATVSTVYKNPFGTEAYRTIQGRVESRREALNIAADMRGRLASGGRVEVKTQIIGG